MGKLETVKEVVKAHNLIGIATIDDKGLPSVFVTDNTIQSGHRETVTY